MGGDLAGKEVGVQPHPPPGLWARLLRHMALGLLRPSHGDEVPCALHWGGPHPDTVREPRLRAVKRQSQAPVLPCDPNLCPEGRQDHVLIHEGYVSVTLTFHHQRQLRTRDPGSGIFHVPNVTF